MKEALLDTDIVSYYLKGEEKVRTRIAEYLSEFNQLNISLITYYEVLNGLMYKGASSQIKQFDDFCVLNNVFDLNMDTMRLAAKISATLKRNGTRLENQDIYIAAVALENDCKLVTNNTKHFARIENLEIENWKQP